MQLIQSNPALSRGFEETKTGPFNPYSTPSGTGPSGDTMTLAGTIDKTIIAFAVLLLAAFVGWQLNSGLVMMVGLLGGLGVALVTAFKPNLAPKTVVPYAVLEGLFLGGVSHVYNDAYDGIVLTAAGLTMAIFGALLFLYKSRIIHASRNFVLAVSAATIGIGLFYLVGLGISLFTGGSLPLVNSNSGWGIAFSVFVVVLASANLVVDFDFIERGAESGAPKYMEWYGAFGLMVTLVWLYLELLRLLAKLRSND